ncbi:MAG: hypothetical protein ACE5GH_07215 [Fidelibacterota bacterium]
MEAKIQKAKQKSVMWGVIGGLVLLSVYFVIVSLANSFAHAIEGFSQLWYWIIALTLGFGIQVGLYVHVRQTVQLKKEAHGATSALATAGGISTVSMVACCAHHVTDFLPILGLSAAAAFLSAYQVAFIVLGIISNLLGVTYMLSMIARHHLYFDANTWLARLARYNYRRVFRVEIPLLLVIFLVSTVMSRPQSTDSGNLYGSDLITLEQREVAGNGIWVDVRGTYDRDQRTLTFAIRFTTHSGSLDFQVDRIASLDIDGREVSLPVSWSGSPPGGHHRSGDLRFEKVPANIESVTLRLREEGPLGLRSFRWNL